MAKTVAICVPHGDRADPTFFRNLLAVQYGTKTPVDFIYIELDYRVVSLARHMITEKALEAKCDYLFWVDDDILPPADALDKLLAHDKDFVSAFYVTRTYPHTPQIYERVDGYPWSFRQIFEYPKALFRVGAVGHGCCLVKAQVYEYLQRQPVLVGRDGVELSPWYEFSTKRGEDFYFCDRLHEIGIPVLVDTTIVCDHMTESYVNEQHFLQLKLSGVVR